MITVRESSQRGQTRLDWLESRHSFAFGDYFDPERLGFGPLRVINEDWVAPGRGFATHGHRDMEIITYVLEGELRHKDSLGNGSAIRPGEVQRMSAGHGITHSEFNGSDAEVVHLLQIWIEPKSRGIPPSYEQRQFPVPERAGRLCLVASPDGREGSLTIHQDAKVMAASFAAGTVLEHVLPVGRRAYLQVARGGLRINGTELRSGDGAAVEAEVRLRLAAEEDAECLLFDLP